MAKPSQMIKISKLKFLSVVFLILIGLSFASGETVFLQPGDNVQEIVTANPEGTEFIFEPGVYRHVTINPKHNQIFTGKPGAVLSGASVLSDWQREDNLWYVNGQTQGPTNKPDLYRCPDPGYPRCDHGEDLFLDDEPLRHVDSKSKVVPGAWFFDYDNDRIYMADDPSGHKVETSITHYAFRPPTITPVDNVTIRGLLIEKYAITYQDSAISPRRHAGQSASPGAGWVIEQNEIRHVHGMGVRNSIESVLRNNHIHHNGWMSFGGGTNDFLVEGNEVNHNHYARIGCGFGCSQKTATSINAMIRGNWLHHNQGPGLWTDVNNYNTTYEENIIAYNTGTGIKHEISYDAVIRKNILLFNLINETQGNWAGRAQIHIQDSPNVEVYNNKVFVRKTDGVLLPNAIVISDAYRDDDHTHNPSYRGAHQSHNVYVHHNDITMLNGAWTGIVAQKGGNTSIHDTSRFDYNTYHVDDPSATNWQAKGSGAHTWEEFREDGHELQGSVDSIIPKFSGFNRPTLSVYADASSLPVILRADAIADNNDHIAKVEFFVNDKKIGQDSYAPFEVKWFTPEDGVHSLKAVATSLFDGHVVSAESQFTIGSVTGPYKDHVAPALIQAEDYDTGGEGISYHDKSSGNAGQVYRNDDVDIKNVTGGYAVGWFESEEWLTYTIKIPETQKYSLDLRAGTAYEDRILNLLVDGNPAINPIQIPSIKDWGEFNTIHLGTLELNSGTHTITVKNDGPNWIDIDWLRIIPETYSTPKSNFTINNNQVSIQDYIIYNKIYVNNGNTWKEHELESSKKIGSWVLSKGKINIDPDAKYLLAYACTWNNGWDCHENKWQMYLLQ